MRENHAASSSTIKERKAVANKLCCFFDISFYFYLRALRGKTLFISAIISASYYL